MAHFRRLFYTALCAGLLAGLVAAGAHQLGTVPLILQAEAFETPAAGSADMPEWMPESGVERAAYTAAADLLGGIGFALLLAAGLSLRGGEVTWRDGLRWGLAGFAVFTLAPGLGLPPELPGSAAAPLAARQLWWLATVGATGGGLALLAFTRRPVWAALASIMIVLPHLYGAPQPTEGAATAVPEALSRQFAATATVVSFLFWAGLGAGTGFFYRRFASRPA